MSKRDAIIYIPGLLGTVGDDPETLTRKFARSFDRIDQNPDHTFGVSSGESIKTGDLSTQVYTINFKANPNDEAQPLADVFHYNYRDTLTDKFKKRNPISQLMALMIVCLSMSLQFLQFLFSFKTNKSWRDKLQLCMIGGLIFVGFLYALLIAGALFGSLAEPLGVIKDFNIAYNTANLTAIHPALGKGAQWMGLQLNSFLANANKIIAVLVSMGIFTQVSIKNLITSLSISHVCAYNYIRHGIRKPIVIGELAELLEYIAEHGDKYEKIHVVAYSFGTLVAIDLLFPHHELIKRTEMVRSLTTIGCPFDLVSSYWPDYFERRNSVVTTPISWINHYAPLDVLGSNFRKDDDVGKEALLGLKMRSDSEESLLVVPNINLPYAISESRQHPDLLEIIAMKGMRIHSQYWTDSGVAEITCFDQVFRALDKEFSLLLKQ